MLKFFKNPCNRYISLWCINNLNGILYPIGTIINKAVLVAILLISLIEILKYYSKWDKNQPILFKGLNLLLIMYTVYGLLLFITDGSTVVSFTGFETQSMSFILGAWMVLPPIYLVYVYTREGYLTLESLQKWVLVFLLVGVAQYFYTQQQMYNTLLSRGSDVLEFTNGAGYILLSLIPSMLVYNRKVISYTGIAFCVVFIIMAMKRGAIIIAAISLLMIIIHDLRSSKGAYKVTVIVLGLIGIFLLINFIDSMLQTSDYFNARIEATLDGDSSNRDVLYNQIWNTFKYDSGPLQWLFGHGALSTLKYADSYAHNDWLEILFCHGAVGIIIFIYYWKCFYKSSKSLVLSEPSRFCLFLVFIIYGIKTFFSMSIIGMPIYTTIMIGFALADGFNNNSSNYTINEEP